MEEEEEEGRVGGASVVVKTEKGNRRTGRKEDSEEIAKVRGRRQTEDKDIPI